MRANLVTVGLIAAFAVAACGGGPAATDGRGGPGTPTATAASGGGGGGGGSGTETDLEAAARALFEAFQRDDDSAYFAGLSDACRSSAGFGIVSERNNSRHGRINQAGMDIDAIAIDEVQISDFDGSSATVVLVLSGTAGNPFLEGEPNPWIFESGEWHWANCDPFATSGGGGGGLEGTGPDDTIGVGMVPTIADWYVYSTYLLPDANELVTGEGAPPPPQGKVYFMWQVVAQYNGPSASQALADDLAFKLVAGSTTYDNPNDCGGYGFELDTAFVAAPGEQATGALCRAVATGDVGSLFLIVTDKAAGRDYWFGQE